MVQIAQVRYRQVVEIQHVHDIAARIFLPLVVGGDTDDKHAADLVFARPVYHMAEAFHGGQVVVPWGVVADGHNVRFELGQGIA